MATTAVPGFTMASVGVAPAVYPSFRHSLPRSLTPFMAVTHEELVLWDVCECCPVFPEHPCCLRSWALARLILFLVYVAKSPWCVLWLKPIYSVECPPPVPPMTSSPSSVKPGALFCRINTYLMPSRK